MNSGDIIVLAICTIIGVLLVFVVLGNPRKWTEKPQRGTAPGQGQTRKTIHMGSPGQGVFHSFTMGHTKDPQKHAQGMIPAKARKKDKTK
ncbi:MAG: hypothetical protein ACSHWY_08465 [Octadecabacter sp.]